MGFLTEHVRGPHHECETILNDLLALSRAHLLKHHPQYMPLRLNVKRRMLPDRFGADSTVRFLGNPVNHTDEDSLDRYLEDFLLKNCGHGSDSESQNSANHLDCGWDPEDFADPDLLVYEYSRATPWAKGKITAAWSSKSKKRCDSYFAYRSPRDQISPDQPPPVEPTREQLYDPEHIPPDYEKLVADFENDTYICEVKILFLASVPHRYPLRLAVCRRWKPERQETPRYVDKWAARYRDAEEDVVIELTNNISKIQGWHPRNLSQQQRQQLELEEDEVAFVPVQARSGGTRGFSYASSDSDND